MSQNILQIIQKLIYFHKKENMESMIITPKNESEMKQVAEMLKQMGIEVRILSEEEKEDLGLDVMMRDVDRKDTISRDEIMKLLSD